MRGPTVAVAVLGVLVSAGCGGSASPVGTGSTPEPTNTAGGPPSPGNVNCPNGLQPRAGLTRFGSFVGTWQALNHQDPKATADYTADRIPGRITIRCSNDNHVIVEQLHLSGPMQADAALALATGELPDDAKQLYGHQHPGCRTLQYQSVYLSKELGADDPPGVAGIELEGGGATYDPNAVTTVLMDLLDAPGQDANGC